MRARRLPDGTPPREPGDYSWMPYSRWTYRPPFAVGDGEWHMLDPTGHVGAIRAVENRGAHSWVEHEDGSVTFSPSLVMPAGWHGWLQRGVWSSC